jgi:hypothetical protein
MPSFRGFVDTFRSSGYIRGYPGSSRGFLTFLDDLEHLCINCESFIGPKLAGKNFLRGDEVSVINYVYVQFYHIFLLHLSSQQCLKLGVKNE